MTCKQAQQRFDDRLDRPSDPAFDAHVAGCPACRREWHEYQATWELLTRHEAIEPSFGFVERTLRRLDEAFTAPRRNFALRWATAASFAIVLGFSSWLTWQRVQSKHRIETYAAAQQQDYLEDFDVIVSLDQISGGNKL